MRALKNEVEMARMQYHEARYPGDLGAELLGGRRMFIGPVGRVLGGLAAAAAVVALVVVTNRSGDEGVKEVAISAKPGVVQTTPTAVAETRQAGVAETTTGETAGMPAFPSGVELVPTYQALSFPSMPEFPSMTVSDQGSASPTTQEAA